ncbi:MAG: GAF domain-containing protein [Bacteroidetes bacterium]|jgi:signal transduction histidine kinase|nr:GAF domain-containing protein [Bacteroidota bacterium]
MSSFPFDIPSAVAPAQARKLLEISLQLNAARSLDELLPYIIAVAADALDCEAASLLLYDEDTCRLRFSAATGADPEELACIPVPLDNSIAGTIFTENHAVRVQDTADDSRHYKAVDDETTFQTRSLLGVPMAIDGTPVGVLEALNKTTGPFTDADEALLTIVAAQAAIAIRSARQLEQLQQANSRLSELDELKSDVLAIASHELRTPLAAILGYGRILRDEAGEAMAEFADEVLSAGERMQDVTEAMSRMASLRSGALALNKELLPVREIVSDALAALQTTLKAAGHTVDTTLPPEPVYITGDRGLLVDALAEVVENAALFTEDPATLQLSGSADLDHVYLTVTDPGPGIPDAMMARVFEAFYQVEDHLTRSRGGLGLGLTIAREILHLHGGAIALASDGPGEGTTVRLTLPLSAPRP